MNSVKVSGKYQVVIPREIRERLRIRKGQRMLVVDIGNGIEYVPDRDISELRGAYPGLSSEGIRDEEDRY